MVRQSFSSICLVVAAIFIVGGCAQQRKKDADVLDRGPDLEKLVVPGDYADAAIKATGGLQRWAKVKKVQLDCVVTFYQPEGSFYLTEHRFYIYPWSNSIEVFGKEPLGAIAWQLSDGQFRLLPGDDPSAALRDVSAMPVSSRDYAEAILKITTAPVQFLQAGGVFVRGPTPIKMEGLWYDPIESRSSRDSLQEEGPQAQSHDRAAASQSRDRQGAAVKPYWSKVVYYQNRDSSLVDLLWLADEQGEASGLRKGDSSPSTSLRAKGLAEFTLSPAKGSEGKFLAVRGYDYKDVQKNGVLLPTKIEIFRTDARAVSRERLVKIDLK